MIKKRINHKKNVYIIYGSFSLSDNGITEEIFIYMDNEDIRELAGPSLDMAVRLKRLRKYMLNSSPETVSINLSYVHNNTR